MSRITLMTRTIISLCTLFALTLAAGVHAAPGDVLYSGRTPRTDLTWTSGPDGWRVEVAGARPLRDTGDPALPVRELLLLVPVGATIVDVVVEPLATHVEPLLGRLAPAPPLAASDGGEARVDQLAPADGAFPATWGEFRGLHTYRGYRLAAVAVHPVRARGGADGVYDEVEVLDAYEVRAVVDPAAPVAPLLARERLVAGERRAIEDRLARMVANPEALGGYAREDGVKVDDGGVFLPTPVPALQGSAVEYLIVTSAALAPAFQRLADFRTAQGVPALVVSREWIQANARRGVDLQETVRFFLQDAYARWGLRFVLIGGDTDVIPPRWVRSFYYPYGGHTDIPSDMYFSCLDGNWNENGDGWFAQAYRHAGNPGDGADFAPEVGVGRLPASTLATANAMVDKVMAYESAAGGAAWPGGMLFAAEVLFPTNWPDSPVSTDGATYCEAIGNNYIIPCTDMYTTRMYENDTAYEGAVHLSLAALIDTLNAGHHSLFNQIGHGHFFNMSVGDANFRTEHADALTNENTFLLYSLNCASGAFDYACLMERFVQNPHGGSVASIGSSREAFPSVSNNYQQRFFEALLCDGQFLVSDAITASRTDFLGNTLRETHDRWTQLTYSLLGDPALAAWSGSPRPLAIAAPASIAAGARQLTVAVTSQGSPVPGALVCARKGAETYAYGTTGADGTVVLAVNPTSIGVLTLTASGRNLARTQRSVTVTVAGAFLACEQIVVNDATGQGAAIGNGNGVAEAGETVELTLLVRNQGTTLADDVVATLTCDDPGVQILVGQVPVGDIPAGGYQVNTQKLVLRCAAAMDDGTLLDLALRFTAAGGVVCDGHKTLKVEAPECEPVAFVWSDVGYGDGDGVLENNERIAVTLTLKNFGDGRFDGASVRLRSRHANAVVVDSVSSFGAIELKQSAANAPVVTVRFADASLAGSSPCRFVITDNQGRVLRHEFTIAPPAAPPEPATDTTLGPDTIALRWTPNEDADLRGYHVYRAPAPGGPFARVNGDLLEDTSYFQDVGLAQLTRYYYRVTAVDSSLVEGPVSVVVAVDTTPPEVESFPVAFASETSGHLAFGDVDGDLLPDIVLASDEVYAWHRNGQELLDGDHDAQTNGPLTDVGGQFEPAGVTLANLDGAPGAEIIASERSQGYKIHVYRGDGTMLPGWPQTLHMWNWQTPAAGDLDGDGDLEIVVNTVSGRTYAWHHDGTEVRNGDNNPATNGVFLVRPEPWGYSSPALCDLDGDGGADIVFGTSTLDTLNQLIALRHDGTPVPGFPYHTGAGRVICSPAIADLDANGDLEIVFFDVLHRLHVVRQNGTAYPGFPVSRTVPFDDSPGPSPALGDVDGDGRLEIVWAINGGGHRCDLLLVDTGPGGGSGQVVAGWPVQLPGNTESSPVLGDINGDGIPDVVMGIGGGATDSPNNLYAFNADATPITGFPISLAGPVRATPTLCDVDGDGNVNILCGSWDRLLHAWSMPFPYDPDLVPWPTFHGNMHRDGVLGRPLAVPVEDPASVPAAFTALAPYPNPFNPATRVRLYVPADGGDQPLRLAVFDLRGRRVRELHRGPAAPGWHEFTWDGRDDAGRGQASGVYVLRATHGERAATHKMTLVK